VMMIRLRCDLCTVLKSDLSANYQVQGLSVLCVVAEVGRALRRKGSGDVPISCMMIVSDQM